MPPLEYADLWQKAVYWEYLRKDREGNIVVKAPVEISCRWEKGTRQVVTGQGETLSINGTVFVKDSLVLNSILKLGKLVDLTTPTHNLTIVVFQDGEVPDLKNRYTQQTMLVSHYGETLPTIGT